MNTIAIMPNLLMYALQNQNVERQIAKKIDIQFLQTNNNDKECIISGTTSLSDIEDRYNEIPAILIPKEEAEPLPQEGESLLNNDNVQLLITEYKEPQNNAYI
jgi:hypothetical protein